jgi:hypothetical protein
MHLHVQLKNIFSLFYITTKMDSLVKNLMVLHHNIFQIAKVGNL